MALGPALFILMSLVGVAACGKSSQGSGPGAVTPTSPSTPASGAVQSIQRDNDDQIVIRINPTASYYLGHVQLDGGIAQNAVVTLPFARPARYSDNTLHADSPLKYFTDPLRSSLYALVQRLGSDKDGKIDFDVAGTLSGNWFTEDLPVSESGLFGSGPRHLAFVRLVSDPSQLVISSGGRLGLTGQFSIAGSPVATLIAQMLAADRVRVEIVNGTTAPSDFTSQAVVYVR